MWSSHRNRCSVNICCTGDNLNRRATELAESGDCLAAQCSAAPGNAAGARGFSLRLVSRGAHESQVRNASGPAPSSDRWSNEKRGSGERLAPARGAGPERDARRPSASDFSARRPGNQRPRMQGPSPGTARPASKGTASRCARLRRAGDAPRRSPHARQGRAAPASPRPPPPLPGAGRGRPPTLRSPRCRQCST